MRPHLPTRAHRTMPQSNMRIVRASNTTTKVVAKGDKVLMVPAKMKDGPLREALAGHKEVQWLHVTRPMLTFGGFGSAEVEKEFSAAMNRATTYWCCRWGGWGAGVQECACVCACLPACVVRMGACEVWGAWRQGVARWLGSRVGAPRRMEGCLVHARPVQWTAQQHAGAPAATRACRQASRHSCA